jgi:Rap1a immunity proteins
VKLLAAVLLCVLHGVASAQGATFNGVSLKRGLDAYDRIHVTKNASDTDFQEMTLLIGYVSGMLAVHRENNIRAVALFVAGKEIKDLSKKQRSEVESDRLMRLLGFTPLLALPDNVPVEQLLAVLRKYLNEHPERWDQHGAILITAALADAFPRK